MQRGIILVDIIHIIGRKFACDAYEEFKDGKEVEAAERFRKYILSQGGVEDPNILFKRFKGKEFSIEPFLKSKGLID